VVRAISNHKYLLDPPNFLWKATTLEFRALTLGGIQFPMEEYNKENHDNASHLPMSPWIKISGLPYHFFKKFEFECITKELSGSTLLEVDPRSSNHLDFSYLRLKVRGADLEVLSPFHKLKFIKFDGLVTFYTLFFF
jgi:hypothetical protein